MAAGLALSKADVTTPAGLLQDASVLVRRGKAEIRRRTTVLAEHDGVTAVEATSRSSWRVTFDDATVWDVVRVGCRPCGGRR